MMSDKWKPKRPKIQSRQFYAVTFVKLEANQKCKPHKQTESKWVTFIDVYLE